MTKRFLLLTTLLTLAQGSLASDYPKPRVEREMDDMGSVLQGDGLVFRPSKTKSSTTKARIGNSSVNKYLYQAAIEVLDFAPLELADSKTGKIITEWYSPKGQSDVQIRINVSINDDVISTEAIEVKAYERSRIKSRWSKTHKESAIGSILEDKILRRARTLYQEEK